MWVVEQYLPHSINDHLAGGRPWDLDRTYGGLRLLPPFESAGEEEDGFARGNAAALALNVEPIRAFAPEVVVTLSADHIVSYDVGALVARHAELGGAVTMATKSLPGEDVSRYAVVGVEGDRVTRFDYKPDAPEGHTVAIEVFAYDAGRLLSFLDAHADEDLKDYGHTLLPSLVASGEAFAMPFEGYWRDVGTLGSYWRAHMDLLEGEGPSLRGRAWPIRTRGGDYPPARVGSGAAVEDSLLAAGSRVAGAVRRSVLGRGVTVEAGARVEDSVVLTGSLIRAGQTVLRAIVDGDTVVPVPEE